MHAGLTTLALPYGNAPLEPRGRRAFQEHAHDIIFIIINAFFLFFKILIFDSQHSTCPL